jgi:hypothetical protein
VSGSYLTIAIPTQRRDGFRFSHAGCAKAPRAELEGLIVRYPNLYLDTAGMSRADPQVAPFRSTGSRESTPFDGATDVLASKHFSLDCDP